MRAVGSIVAVALALIAVRTAPGQAERLVAEADGVDPEVVLEEVWRLVDEEFLDPQFNGADWETARERYRPAVRAAGSLEALGVVINEMLAELGTSHTRLFTPADRGYYEFLQIFAGSLHRELAPMFPGTGAPAYPGIGLVARSVDGRPFIADVIEGSTAHRAGLLVGDAIISVDAAPFAPVRSFLGKAGADVEIVVQSAEDPASRRTVLARVEMIDPAEQLFDSIRAFNTRIPVMSMRRRRGEAMEALDTQWRKPVVLLVDEGSRSGKEILAWGFKRFDLGPVVGVRTAGAVVGGSPRMTTGGLVLYLAVADVLVDGVRLEGVGVEPDVTVPMKLPFAGGTDRQRDRALSVLARELR